jgi:hypothetical protein
MPTVLRWGRYRAFFYSNEGGEPPHVHVRSNNCEAKVWLNDLAVVVNFRYTQRELGAIIRHLEEHQHELLDAWNDHFRD